MTRRCSHCSNNGHNSRTCPTRMGQSTVGGGSGSSGGKAESGVKLFGVRLTEGGFIMKKSASMGCLSHYSSLAAQASPNRVDSNSSDPVGDNDREAEGYASDDPNHESCSTNRRGDRKKGVPWTEEEHRMFLVGLQKLGKGDWRGIARNFVLSKTPTQVASHAQKYFIRQTNSSRRKRRSSLFDMVPDMYIDRAAPITEEHILHTPPKSESSDNLPSLDRNSERESVPEEPTAERMTMDLEETISFNNLPPLVPAFYPAFITVPYAYWPTSANMPVNEEESTGKTHEVLKPIPVLATDSTCAVELIGMSQLSLSESRNNHSMKPSALSSKLLAATSSRQSAFHANPAVAGSDVSQRNSSDIHAA